MREKRNEKRKKLLQLYRRTTQHFEEINEDCKKKKGEIVTLVNERFQIGERE